MGLGLPPDEAVRERIRRELGTTFLVEAAAGTGKTRSLVDRLVGLIRDAGVPVTQIAAVTFTRTAAAELRERLRSRLAREADGASAGKARDRLRDALGALDLAAIGTIHSFCGRLLRERPFEARVDPGFRELEEREEERLRRRAWDEWVASVFESRDGILEELAEEGIELDQLRAAFERLALYPDVTEWPTAEAPPMDDAGLRATLEDYAREMETIVRAAGDPGNDQVLARYGQVARMVRQADWDHPAALYRILERIKPVNNKDLVQRNWPGKKLQAEEAHARWNAFAERAAPYLAAWRARRYQVAMRALEPAVARYDRLRRDSGGLHFQDLLMRAAELLREHPGAREAFRARYSRILVDEFQDTDPIQAEVLAFLAGRGGTERERDWRKCPPAPGALFVVGDPKQSIFRFRRADITIYHDVQELIERSGGEVLRLSTSFRTVSPLVEWVNGVFDSGVFPAAMNDVAPAYVALEPFRPSATGGAESVVCLDHAAMWAAAGIKPSARAERRIEIEARHLATWIRRCVESGTYLPRTEDERERGCSEQAAYGDFLILTYRRAVITKYAEALRDQGIPHAVLDAPLGTESPLATLAGVFRAIVRVDDEVALLSVLRGPAFGISDRALYRFHRPRGGVAGTRNLLRLSTKWPDALSDDASMSSLRQAFARLKRYRDWLQEGPLPVTLERIAADLGLWGLAAAIGQCDPLERGLDWLRARWHSFLSLEELLAEFEELAMGKSHLDWSLDPRGGGHGVVRVMNLHKAKGLEAPIVILADPSNAQDTTADLHIDRSGGHSRGWTVISEERSAGDRTIRELLAHPPDWDLHAARESQFLEAERHRLLYVAATRAGVQIVVSADLSESPKSEHLWQFFGPFLAGRPVIELSEETVESTKRTDGKSAAPSAREVSQAMAEARSLVETMTRPGSVARTVGELAKRAPARRFGAMDEASHGTAWGRVIHQLLEYRMTRPEADLRTAARGLLADEEESLVDRLPEALELVESVARSKTWLRATACADRFVEIPFTLPWELPDESGSLVPGLLHGRLDLVFREPEGWVIVDYKTDPIPREGVGSLVAHYRDQVALYAEAWERITGEPVHEAGLYFTRAETYVEVRIGS